MTVAEETDYSMLLPDSREPLRTNLWRGDPRTGCQDALSLCQIWLKTCLDGHKSCYDGDGTEQRRRASKRLPTRVIDCTPLNRSSDVCLVESNGRYGTWVALSHCWGKGEQRPLMTLRANIRKHLGGLQLNSLPKTFQDAVVLTRSLNIRYLWIDSLCIVQDDPEDWKRESNTMGTIYQNAIITIAAGYAENSSEGCFVDDKCLSFQPPCQRDNVLEKGGDGEFLISEESLDVARRVILPFFEADKVAGSFYIAPWAKEQPPDGGFLTDSPLFKRGWVLQEWTLSRRSIIFLKDSILWSCRELCVNESGKLMSHAVERPSMLDWESLIEKYSGMDLTYESDRLVAIQGLSNIVQMQRRDKYFAGMWPDDLPESLLWKVRDGDVGRLALQRSHLPSWTWASIEGHVGFQLSGHPCRPISPDGIELDSRQRLQNVLHEFAIQPSGALYVVGPMTHLKTAVFDFVARSEPTRSRYKSVFKQAFKGYSNCRQAGGSIYGEQMVIISSDDPLSTGCEYRLHHPEFAGWATLDLDTIPDPGSVYCVAVKKEIGAILRNGRMGGKRTFIEDDGYHVLLLRSVPSYGTIPRFVRIGIGVIQVSCRIWYVGAAEIV